MLRLLQNSKCWAVKACLAVQKKSLNRGMHKKSQYQHKIGSINVHIFTYDIRTSKVKELCIEIGFKLTI